MITAPVNDTLNRLWCGPAAISAIAGISVSKINKMVRRIRKERYGAEFVTRVDGKKRAVIGMHNNEVVTVMKRLGYKVNPRIKKTESMTLKGFFDNYGHMGPFIVWVTNHYVVIDSGMILDNQIASPMLFSEYPKYHRAHVRNFWKFEK